MATSVSYRASMWKTAISLSIFDGRDVIYGFGELDEQEPGLGIPGRGDPPQHYPMLRRNLVYTGVTWGKRLVVLVGQRKALAIAVKGDQKRRRWSKLREWLAVEA